MNPHVIDVDQSGFASAVIEASHTAPVVVDFWAAWCGPCKVLSPTLERMAAEGAGSWTLAKVDVDQNPQLSQQFGVQGIPTVIAFRDGVPVNRFTGAVGEAQVRSFLESVIPSELDLAVADADAAADRGDLTAAEDSYRKVLALDPAHEGAGTGLASMLIDRDDPEEALEVLARLPRTETVRRLEAAARLSSGSADVDDLAAAAEKGTDADRLALAKALAAGGRVTDALEQLLDIVTGRGEAVEEARLVILDLFELLGADNPVVTPYRKRLASALF